MAIGRQAGFLLGQTCCYPPRSLAAKAPEKWSLKDYYPIIGMVIFQRQAVKLPGGSFWEAIQDELALRIQIPPQNRIASKKKPFLRTYKRMLTGGVWACVEHHEKTQPNEKLGWIRVCGTPRIPYDAFSVGCECVWNTTKNPYQNSYWKQQLMQLVGFFAERWFLQAGRGENH